METQDPGRVIYEKEDSGVARLILNWPEKANLQDPDMVWAFDKALGLAEYDYDVKVLVIKSNAKGFCAGHVATGDYPESDENRRRTGTTWQGHTKLFLHPMLRLWEFPKPTIAQVHGYAAGGGSYWALLPDQDLHELQARCGVPLPATQADGTASARARHREPGGPARASGADRGRDGGRDRPLPRHDAHRLQAPDQTGVGADGLPRPPAVVRRHDHHRHAHSDFRAHLVEMMKKTGGRSG